MKDLNFVAIDFETANRARDSVCQVGLVRYEGGVKAGEFSMLIKPPSDEFEFTHIHNISWDMVCDSPCFEEAWNDISAFVGRPDFFAAHNAPFDKGVFHACCESAGLPKPDIHWIDTVKVAREVWNIYPTKLNRVCAKRNIELNHHEALSDARACGEILCQAWSEGWRPAGKLRV